jgi:hypothetical protein
MKSRTSNTNPPGLPHRGWRTMRKPSIVLAGVACAASLLAFGAAPAQADNPSCGSPDVPCAPPLTSQQQCALIAWRTWIPCNWVGVQVPSGTPGSVG